MTVPHAFRKFDLSGRTAVVTGGGSGLGYCISRALAQAGAKVLIGARREDVLARAAESLSADPLVVEKVRYAPVDLGDRESVAAFADRALSEFGGVDIFVGNAAQDGLEPLDAITNETMDQMFQVNVSANVELVRAFLPNMRKQRWGRFIFISSASAVLSSPHEGCAMYTSMKGALGTFTRTAATETGHDGITVNSLVMGMFLTDIVKAFMADFEAAQSGGGAAAEASFASMTALGRLGETHEIEGMIQLLASDAGSYITGTNLEVDGGMTIMLRPNPPSPNVVRAPNPR